MSDERRYDEDEVREIFEAAAEAREAGLPAVSSGGGITLAELETIGEEVGLPAERVRQAAASLDASGVAVPAVPRRTFAGLPIGVGRTVELARAPTDEEWEILVGELRETFHARGKVEVLGRTRSWSNGNLQAHIEPTVDGYRLRLSTLKGDAAARGLGGGFMISFALLILVVLLIQGRGAEGAVIAAMLGGVGTIVAGSSALTLPRWAAQRERQMEYIADRAVALIGPPAPIAGGAAPAAGLVEGD